MVIFTFKLVTFFKSLDSSDWPIKNKPNVADIVFKIRCTITDICHVIYIGFT